MNLTHLIEILTAIVLGGSILAGLVRTVAMLTRIADSVERLSSSMERVVASIGDHETRLTRLEDEAPRSRRTAERKRPGVTG